MSFDIRAVFPRSICLEMQSSEIYETAPYRILLNGEERLADTRNAVSLFGLSPDTEYSLTVIRGEERTEQRFRTNRESVLLNVRDFGAAGDGVTNDTAALQAAIAACPAEGTVSFPAGTYLSGPLFLKSRIRLYLEKDAVLLGDPERAHYPLLPGMTEGAEGEYNLASWEGNPETSFASLLTGIDVTELDIYGEGTIDGNADRADWWADPKRKRTAWRPKTIFLCRCEGVRMQGITVRNSPSWTIHPYYSERIALYNAEIWNPSDSPNTDGFDPESCRDVLLLGCRISVGDDCIAIKSGKLYMSTHYHRAAERITVRNCLLERGHGSVTIGSEAAGGVADVEVSQCIFRGTDRGLRIKTRRGRGPYTVYDRIRFHDIRMEDVLMPFTLNMFYFCDPDGHSDYVQNQTALPVDERTPRIGTITAENIRCTGAEACILCAYGLPEQYIGCLRLRNIEAVFRPRAERKPRQAIMMDHFPDLDGISVYARNVQKLVLDRLSIAGSADEELQLINVNEYDSQNVVYHT